MAQSIMELKLSQLMSAPKFVKKSILARFLLFLIILLIWVYINGGWYEAYVDVVATQELKTQAKYLTLKQ